MKLSLLLSLLGLSFYLLFQTACSFDQLVEPTPLPMTTCDTTTINYDVHIAPILETYCTLNSDCHGSGSPFGDYTSYVSMFPILNENGFENRTVIQKDDPTTGMPPDYSSGPIDFTPEDFELIQCWINEAYPEN